MGPRIYPSYQDTNTTANGSLILKLNTYANFIDVYVNNNLVNNLASNVNGLYVYSLNINDVVTISEPANWNINVVRRDYLTDDNNNDLGIVDTFITGTTVTDSYTFTATTSPSSYNFEYRISIDNFAPTPMPTPLPCPSVNYIQSGLTLYTDFGANVSYPLTGSIVYDLEGNYNGNLSGQTYLNNFVICDRYLVLQQNNVDSKVYYPSDSVTGTTFDFSFGGWVYVSTAIKIDNYYSRGETGTKLSSDIYNRPVFSLESAGGNTLGITGSTQLNYQAFNHLYATVRNTGSQTEMKLYMNGVLQGTRLRSLINPKNNGGWFNEWNINDFTVYTRALSDAEVLSNYNLKTSLFPYTPLTSGITFEYVYNYTGGTGNINLEKYTGRVNNCWFPFVENSVTLTPLGGSITGSSITYQNAIVGTMSVSTIKAYIDLCKISGTASITSPRQWRFYVNGVLKSSITNTGTFGLNTCTSNPLPYYNFTYENFSGPPITISDGDVLRYEIDNYFLPDVLPPTSTPTPLPTSTPTPLPATATPTPTPTATPLPFVLDGLTGFYNTKTESYPGTGTTWTNISPSGSTYNFILSGTLPTFSGGTPGYLEFSGLSGQYGYASYAAIGSNFGEYTLSMWVQVPTGTTQEGYFTRGNQLTSGGESLVLGKTTDNKFFAKVKTADNTIAIATGTTIISSTTWYNITLRWIPNTNVSIWVNGVKEAQANRASNQLKTANSSGVGWYIMNDSTLNNAPGKLSQYAMYFRSLSDAEILANFDSTKTSYGY